RIIRTPVRAPQANAIAERWIGLRRECLDQLLITGPRHLAAVLQEYLAHYNTHRPHRSLHQHPPAGRTPPDPGATVRPLRRDRLGGLIHEYLQVAWRDRVLGTHGSAVDVAAPRHSRGGRAGQNRTHHRRVETALCGPGRDRGTIHQAVATTGIRRSRYLGLPKTHLAHVFTATAINLIRLDAWWTGSLPGQTRTSHLTKLALRL
ncbi:MAG: putative transposase, partial [Pseudonocardia sp.]|nr:putative transposase [Pseudonocardia sp.]